MNFEKLYKEKNIVQLKNLADVRFGYYVQPEAKGDVQYIQARQFDGLGNMVSLSESSIDKDKKSEEHLLSEGDILFAGKGYRNFAWCYHRNYGPAIASSIFFVIRPDQNIVLPEYLTILFNRQKSQAYFAKLGAGTSINSIRKNELGEFKVPLLPMEQQHKVIALNKLHSKYMKLTQEMLQLKVQRFESVIDQLINI
ncbi:MAG: restriction endonuclease subunit S [Sphingobacteriales bacterium]|nr:MAG: restriction endonuclease subunit S [Sphingobacteriales bacterium]